MAKKIKPDALFELTFVSDPVLSADGALAAAVHTVIEMPEEEGKGEGSSPPKPPFYRSEIHLYDLFENTSRPFVRTGKSNTQPRFSPDGAHLAFLSKREEEDKPQLYLIPLAGGEAERLTDYKAGVSAFAWHPEGDRLAFVSRGDWEDEDHKAGRGRVIERMFYKNDGVGFRAAEPAQIYLFELEKRKAKVLSKLKSDPSGLVFSPDGGALYFSGAKNVEADDRWESSVWRLPTKGGKAKALVKTPTMTSSPAPSPDGEHIAFFAPTENENFAAPTGLWLVPSGGGAARLLSHDLDAAPSVGGDSRYGALPNTPQWSDARTVYINANREGRSGLAAVDIETGSVKPLDDENRVVTSFRYAAGGFLFTAETPHQPGELFYRGREEGQVEERRLSRVNDAFVEKYRLSEVQAHEVQAENGPTLAYWTLAPTKARKDKALVLQVHGGPHTNYGYGFSFEFQLLASAGYTVVFGNPRGSSSYGADFATAMLGGYGTIDADDVLTIARAARADKGAPMHLTGGSYGGFMTNWLVGHTDEFQSAVTQRSICNWLSFYGASDIGYRFGELEVAGNPWENLERLWEQSPLKYVNNVNTPTLIIHAEEDHRCPVEQAEQFFVALKRIGKADTKFIRFPGEGHELSRSGRPDRRVQRLEVILEWFGAHA